MMKKYLQISLFSLFVLSAFSGARHMIWNTSFDFHQVEAQEPGKYTFLVVHRGRGEEKEYAMELIRAGKTLNWQGYEVSLKPSKWSKYRPLQPFMEIVKNINPDFIISMTKDLPPHDARRNYLLLSHREYDTIKDDPSIFDPLQWKAVLTLPSLIDQLQRLYPKNTLQCLPWYWSSFSTEFYEPDPKRIFQFSSDSQLSASFKKLSSLLDRSGYLDTFQSSADINDKMEAIHQSGIALVLHSEYQFGSHVPSHHFFDAIAASAVVIVDRHPFIEKEFKDSVLYIERSPSGEEMYQRVHELIEWIWNHQEEASLLAKRAHTIFHNKFTLQKFLLDLEELHLSC